MVALFLQRSCSKSLKACHNVFLYVQLFIQGDPKKTGPNSNYSKYTGPVFFGSPCIYSVHMHNFKGFRPAVLFSIFYIIIFFDVIITCLNNAIVKVIMMHKLEPKPADLKPIKAGHVNGVIDLHRLYSILIQFCYLLTDVEQPKHWYEATQTITNHFFYVIV